MIFSTRKEAEAHDKMLAIAERLSAFLQGAELNLGEDTLEALSWYMAQHREDLGTLLRGAKLPTLRSSGQTATALQESSDVSPAAASKSPKTASGASATKPKTAA